MEYAIESPVVTTNKIVNKRNAGPIILESGNCPVIAIIAAGIPDSLNASEIDRIHQLIKHA